MIWQDSSRFYGIQRTEVAATYHDRPQKQTKLIVNGILSDVRPGAVSYRDFRRYIARVHDLRVQRMPEAKWSVTDQTTDVNQG